MLNIKKDNKLIGKELYDFIVKLFPITRSITGNGVRETLSIIGKKIPIEVHEIPSGQKVLDWEVPDEWNISEAWIKNSSGKKILDLKNSNLHILNYSIPIDKTVSYKELCEHVFSLPKQPELIPYRTSYYKKNWGFCMSQNQLDGLDQQEQYHVKIDSSLEKGFLTYGEYFIQGEIDDEVLISTHICHPSLADDNLSGTVVATELAKRINESKPYYSYRFLFIPGTIGSITWLSLNEEKLDSIKYGLVLNLLGDSGKFNYKKSRRGNAAIDRIVEYTLKSNQKEFGIMDFYPYGYDERQFCSPGFNLPVGRLSRAIHGEFPEYHTSADNLDFVHPEKLGEALTVIAEIINVIEINKKYINLKPKGEPQLGKRGLYKNVSGQGERLGYEMALLWMLNYSDGCHSLLDIAIKSGVEILLLNQAAQDLVGTKLLKEEKNSAK